MAQDERDVAGTVRNAVWDSVNQKWVKQPLDAANVEVTSGETVELTHDPDLDTGGALVTALGSAGVPLSQNEIAREDAGLNGLFVRDLDLQTVFGTQPLLNNQRLMTEDGSKEQVVAGILRTAVVNTEFLFSCEGFNSLAVQLLPAQAGAWTGTVTFEASLDNVTWYAQFFTPIAIALPVATATVSGIYRFNVAGLTRFRVRTSTAGTLNAYVLARLSTAAGVLVPTTNITGSLLQSISQRATTFETNTYDTNVAANTSPNIGLIRDAFISPEWYSNTTYNIGDTVLWNGQIYRCILSTVGITPIPYPNNATYFTIDPRQNKSLVTGAPASPPLAARVRVEIDLDAYQYRLAEETMFAIEMDAWGQLIAQDYQLDVQQSGVGQGVCNGKNYALGQSGMSAYNIAELR